MSCNHGTAFYVYETIRLSAFSIVRIWTTHTPCSSYYRIDTATMVTTDEQVLLLPRGFVYDVQHPDSMIYLSCISSDKKDFSARFGKDVPFVFPAGVSLIRSGSPVTDTIYLHGLKEKLMHFKGSGTQLSADTRYVLVYYLPAERDADFRKNVCYFERYIRRHKELHIQAIYPIIE